MEIPFLLPIGNTIADFVNAPYVCTLQTAELLVAILMQRWNFLKIFRRN